MNEIIMKIKVRLEDKDFKPIVVEEKGDWIDLAIAEDVVMQAGDHKLLSFGMAMKIPEGFEAHLLPRSSTFNKYGILMANSMGIIDNSYCGNNDIWKMSAYATRPIEIKKGTRIAQFRLMPTMRAMLNHIANPLEPKMWINNVSLTFDFVDDLGTEDRGGFGSTGN